MEAPALHQRLEAAVRRARGACLFYAAGWAAAPVVLLGLAALPLVAGPEEGGARALLAAVAAPALLVITAATATFLWFMVSLARATGHAGLPPLIVIGLDFLCPVVVIAFTTRHVQRALLSLDRDPASATPLPSWLVWAGAWLYLPTALAWASLLAPGRTQTATILAAVVCSLYPLSRLVLALRLRRLCADVLLRVDVDRLRAAHVAPVGGG